MGRRCVYPGFARVVAGAVAFCLASPPAGGDTWPMHRHDVRRSGITAEPLAVPLRPAWTYACAQPPAPAWPEPGKNLNRLDFDYAAALVIAEGLVCFGSSADDTVRALDARTGALRWQFVTGGPVRFPPQIVGDRVYVGSDDGCVYGLDTATGKEVWRRRGGPRDECVIGNGRVISRWPIRTGVLVDQGVVYAVAGMWPADGIFLYALEAATGKVLWCNDTAGSGIPRQSHGYFSLSGLNPQGALAVTDDVLLIPNGRCAPASVDRHTGALLVYEPGGLNNGTGSSWLTVESNLCYVLAKSFYSPRVVNAMTIPQLALAGSAAGAMPQNCVFVGDWQYSFFEDHVAQLVHHRRLFARVACGLMRAGDRLVVGENGQVRIEDIATTNTVWSAPVSGGAYELAAADGRLYVSTDKGQIACFVAEGKEEEPGNRKAEVTSQHSGVGIQNTETSSQTATDGNQDPKQSKIATLLHATNMDRGYAVVCGDAAGTLARTLAAQTRLHLLSVLSSAEAQTLRSELLANTALYGSRIHVIAATNLSALPLPHWIANAVIVAQDTPGLDARELYRLLRPAGGVLLAPGWSSERWQTAAHEAAIPEAELNTADGRRHVVRGRLPGAWDWDAKTPGDERVKWPLRLQWFGAPGAAETYNRKVQAATVAAANGRFFVIGDTALTAVDAYNGHIWWRRPLPFAPRGHGATLYADAESLYLTLSGFRGGTNGAACVLLDPLTGRQQKLYAPYAEPPRFTLQTPQTWTVKSRDPKGTESEEGTVHLARDAEGLTVTLQAGAAEPKRAREWGVFLDFRPPERRFGLYEPGVYHVRVLPPTNATGAVLWRAGQGEDYPPLRVSGSGSAIGSTATLTLAWKDLACLGGREPESFGFAAAVAVLPEFPAFPFLPRAPLRQGLLFCGPWADGLNDGWAELHPRAAATAAGPPPALRAGGFTDLPKEKRQGKAPNIGPSVPGSPRRHPLTDVPTQKFWYRGDTCGGFSLSYHLALARSGMLGFYDFTADDGWHFFNGVRPSCGYSSMAANGIAFAGSGGSGCDCTYSFLTSVALSPAERRAHEDWSVFGEWPADTLVRRAHLNFGAPGDRKDDAGDLWLGFPRPALAALGPVGAGNHSWHNIPGIAQKDDTNKSMALAVPLDVVCAENGGPYRRNADLWTVNGTERPWIYASGYRGIRKAVLKLNFLKPLTAQAVQVPLTIDGRLNEPQWAGAPAAELRVTKTRFHLRYDAERLYVAAVQPAAVDAKGQAQAWNRSVTNRDALVWTADCLELFLGDAADARSVHLGVAAGGAQYDAWSVSNQPYNARWNAAWTSAVTTDTNAFTVELALPWKLLADAGVDRHTLVLNAQMSSWHNRGEALVSLGGQGRVRCRQFVPVGYDRPPDMPPRAYTVRLHFAEPDDAPPARRVFDVVLQGQPALKNFDIAKEVGPRRALVKDFPHVLAQETLTLEFTGRGAAAADTLPVLCGLELAVEQPGN